ncbi:hypothetical protein AB0O64_24875 [Streptomyces sp. NPDC088341]|uniref:hypothetical protein n=1 Tax=Streptomyces sp. NPDC088341 TaxID=3154870 RepID=UPI003414E44E
MESLGDAYLVVVWGGPVVAALLCGLVVLLITRWRRNAIADLERRDPRRPDGRG